MQKLLLIDGHNLLFQMFFGMPNKIIGKNGQNIEGVWGFTSALLKIINKVEPTHILVILNGEQKLDENDKNNRENFQEMEKNPFSILPDVKKVLEELNIAYFETYNGYETDDFIKEYCNQYEKEYEIVISSFDYDYIALINQNVSLLTYRGSSTMIYTPEKVLSKWHIPPKYFADYKALVGDASDNIAGIPRIGPKMAANLINEFGFAEEILAKKEQIQKDNIRLTLDIFEKDLLHNIELIRLKGTGEIPLAIKELTFENKNRKTKEILYQLDLLESEKV